jgi:hypothetical protein
MLRRVIKRLPVILSLGVGIVLWTPSLWRQALGDQAPSQPTSLLLSAVPAMLLEAYLAGWMLAIWDGRDRSCDTVMPKYLITRRTFLLSG